MKKVTVYSTTTCPYCVMLKRWLDDNKVEYTDYLVDKNPYAAQIMIRQSGQSGVPFTSVEDESGATQGIIGFDRQQIATALGIA
jgi:glutaredoxin